MFRFHGNGLLKGYMYFFEILLKIMLFSFTVNFSSDLNRKMNIDSHTYFCNFNRYNKNNIIKIDDVIGIAQYLADKQNFLYIYLFS